MARKKQPVVTKRKTPIQNRSEQTVDMIYDATAQILDKHGAQKLTTATIAACAGFSIGTLYQYFPNKNSILVAMAWRERDKIKKQIITALKDAKDKTVEDSVRSIVKIILGVFSGRFRARKIIIRAVMVNMNIKPFIEAQNEIVQCIADEMQQINHADLRPVTAASTYVMSRALLGTIRAAIMEENSLLGTKEFEDELVKLLTRYLLK